jgi:hypothetical protein
VIKRMPERNRFMKGCSPGRASARPAVEYDARPRKVGEHQVPLLEAVDARDRRHHLGLDRAAAGVVLSGRRDRGRALVYAGSW